MSCLTAVTCSQCHPFSGRNALALGRACLWQQMSTLPSHHGWAGFALSLQLVKPHGNGPWKGAGLNTMAGAAYLTLTGAVGWIVARGPWPCGPQERLAQSTSLAPLSLSAISTETSNKAFCHWIPVTLLTITYSHDLHESSNRYWGTLLNDLIFNKWACIKK